jgi:hypothetical protein
MRKKFSVFMIAALALYGSIYLAVNRGFINGSYFLAEIVNISATVPPTIVAIEDTPAQSSGGGGAMPVTYNKKEVLVVKPSEPVIPAEPVMKPITEPVAPPKMIAVEPIKETVNVVIKTNPQPALDGKVMEPYVEPKVVLPYLDPFMPNILRKETTEVGPIDNVLEEIMVLNVDKVSPKDQIDLYANKPIIFTGKTSPYAKLEITFFSKIQKATIFADKNGDWYWSPPRPVDVGDHTFNVVIKAQGTDQFISDKHIPFVIKPQNVPNIDKYPIYISLTPGYQPVSNEKPFSMEINFYRYNETVEYPVKIDYQIFNTNGALYGEGRASADPGDGSVVRLPIELKPGTEAGFYRIRVFTTVLGQKIFADAVFKVLENIEVNVIETDRIETENENNLLVLKIFLSTLVIAGGVYFFVRRK